jgi:acetyl esterase/lipase
MDIEHVNLTQGNANMNGFVQHPSPELRNMEKRPAILVFPGGGYYGCSDREAEPIALAYMAHGYQAFVLRYSCGETATFAEALEDAEWALETIRSNSDPWHLDPKRIALIGFSAGGHLAAALATMGKVRPNALLLGYPCILKSIEGKLAFPVPGLESKVDGNTPPTFLFGTSTDEIVGVEHTLSFANALAEAKLAFELHIFHSGTHGLSVASQVTSAGRASFVENRVASGFLHSIDWLNAVLVRGI